MFDKDWVGDDARAAPAFTVLAYKCFSYSVKMWLQSCYAYFQQLRT